MIFFSLVVTLVFLIAVPYATNYSLRRPPVVCKILVAIIGLFFLLSQSKFRKVHISDEIQSSTRIAAMAAEEVKQEFLKKVSVIPASFNVFQIEDYPQLISASLVNTGAAALVINLCLFWIFGSALESAMGRRRFAVFALLSCVVPMFINVVVAQEMGWNPLDLHAGFSGILYCFAGGWYLLFRKSRIVLATVTETNFWYTIFFFIFPLSLLATLGSHYLGENLLIWGFVGLFFLKQPAVYPWSIPPAALLIYKFFQDIFVFNGMNEHVYTSPVLCAAGFLVGMAASFALTGTKRIKEINALIPVYKGPLLPLPFRKKQQPTKRLNLARLAEEAYYDEEKAKLYLGQRVFVGDSDKAAEFYRLGVMGKFPGLMLDPRDQVALARMLNTRELTHEALHAYEKLLNMPEVPAHMKEAWFVCAQLLYKTESSRMRTGLGYLDRFMDYDLTKRERSDANRLRADIMHKLNMTITPTDFHHAPKNAVPSAPSPAPVAVTPPDYPELPPEEVSKIPDDLIARLKVLKAKSIEPETPIDLPAIQPAAFDKASSKFLINPAEKNTEKQEIPDEPVWEKQPVKVASVDDFIRKKTKEATVAQDLLIPEPDPEKSALYQETDPFASISVKPRGRTSWLEVEATPPTSDPLRSGYDLPKLSVKSVEADKEKLKGPDAYEADTGK